MRKVKLKMLFIAILIMAITLLSGVTSAVTLQANPNTHNVYRTKAVDECDKYFREMEGPGGAMGLNESLNADLTSTKSNGIDGHMMKNTEYGAIAILSASGYGNPSNEQRITTTTGNNTGIMMTTRKDYAEYVAATGDPGSLFNGINARYIDIYGAPKRGDATGSATDINPGCNGWHQAGAITLAHDCYIFTRGDGSAGIFACHNIHDSAFYRSSDVVRGVAVCGEGL